MEKFRYRKQEQTFQDGGMIQMHNLQSYQQHDYRPHQTHNQQQQQQQDYGHDHELQTQQFGHDQRQQHQQQISNDHKQHQNGHDHRQPQQQLLQQHQYVPELRQYQQQETQGQRKVKQHTDWNGVLQDLFGRDMPQTAESTHESTSSGVASDVTSVYLPTPIMTTFKGGESASSEKSSWSHDSGNRSASASGSPRPDQLLQKPYPRGIRTAPTVPPPVVPRDATSADGKNIRRLTDQCSPNGYHQINDCPSSAVLKDKRQSRERRHRFPETNCTQCSTNINNRSYNHQQDIDNSPNFNNCRSANPAFCHEVDQLYVDDVRDQQFIEPFREDRYISSPFHENSDHRDRQHIIPPSMSPTSQPGYCCNQQVHQNNHSHHLPSDISSRNLKSCYKQQHHIHPQELQQQHQDLPSQNSHMCTSNDNNRKTNFESCNHYNQRILSPPSQSRVNELSISPNLQTFKSKIQNNMPRMPHHQASKLSLQSNHNASEKQPGHVFPQSQIPKGSQMLLTHAQIHTSQSEIRNRNETRKKSMNIQPESQVNNFSKKIPPSSRQIDPSPNLWTGINNMSLTQMDKQRGKATLMSTNGKRLVSALAPFEFLPNDVLLKIFSHLPTDHLCKCAQVCHHWYNVVWDNPMLWTSIVINNQNIDIDRALKYLTRRLSYNTPKVCMILEKININTCCRLSDRGLQTVAKRCPELRYLDMQSCHLITNVGVQEAVSRCVNLERLDVTGCPLVTCVSLMESLISQSASRHLQRIYLRYLDMTDCQNITDEDMCITTSQCTQLLFLYLRRCPLITDLGVTYIANNCSSLRELSLSDCKNVTDLGMRELAKLRDNLRYLSVAKCEKVSDQGVTHIARDCSKLRYLNVRGCEAFSDTGLEFLARNCPRLRSLDIGKCDITDDGLYALSMYCPNLRKLGVKSCDAITDKGIVLIAYRCSSLQQLHVQDCCLSLDAYVMVRKYCKRAIIEHTNPAIL